MYEMNNEYVRTYFVPIVNAFMLVLNVFHTVYSSGTRNEGLQPNTICVQNVIQIFGIYMFL